MARTKTRSHFCQSCHQKKQQHAKNCEKLIARKIRRQGLRNASKKGKLLENIKDLVNEMKDIKLQKNVGTLLPQDEIVDLTVMSDEEETKPSGSQIKRRGKQSIILINDTIDIDAEDNIENTSFVTVDNTSFFEKTKTSPKLNDKKASLDLDESKDEDCWVVDMVGDTDSIAESVEIVNAPDSTVNLDMTSTTPSKLDAEISCLAHLKTTTSNLDNVSPMIHAKKLQFCTEPMPPKTIERLEKRRNRTMNPGKVTKNTRRNWERSQQQRGKFQISATVTSTTNGSGKIGESQESDTFFGPAVKPPKKPEAKANVPAVPISERPLREIIIDGQNVARGHGTQRNFSAKGIQLVVEYFQIRGHKVIVFLPNYCQGYDEKQILKKLEDRKILIYTPSRKVSGKRIEPYDDRYILEYASQVKGIVVSRDQYRDLLKERPEFEDTITSRLLMYTFVGDHLMFPVDPLGKNGPNIEEFLRLKPSEFLNKPSSAAPVDLH